MKATDFTSELQSVASEMKLTNIFTTATKEQLEIAASNCTVENYKWETSEASFLMKDSIVKGVRLFDNGQEINDQFDMIDLYEDFKANGTKC